MCRSRRSWAGVDVVPSGWSGAGVDQMVVDR